MRITKLGHCCLIIEEAGVKLLTDPGTFTTSQNEITGIDAVLITHEHGDHYHIDSIKTILKNNPGCVVVTNGPVGTLLAAEGIQHILVDDGKNTEVRGVPISGYGREHAYIYETVANVENTGFYIAEKLFYPGDAFYNPKLASIDILALPVAGPWMKISEALDYARAVKPRVTFPVHDGMIRTDTGSFAHRMSQSILEKFDIAFISMGENDSKEF